MASHTKNSIEAAVKRLISKRLNIPENEIDVDEPFPRYGMDSLGAVTICGELEEEIGIQLEPTVLLDHPTISKLSTHLLESTN